MELSTSSGNVLALNSFCTLDTPTVDPVEEVLDEFDNYDLEAWKPESCDLEVCKRALVPSIMACNANHACAIVA